MLEQQQLATSFVLDPRMALAWLAPAGIAAVAMLRTQHRAYRIRHRLEIAVDVLVLAYLVAIAVLVLWPWDVAWSADAIRNGNRIPLHGSLTFLLSADPIQLYLGERQTVMNVLLIAPVGLLLPLVFGGHRGIVVIAVVAVIALAAEAASGLAPPRVFDIDDALAAFAGGVAAAAATNVMHMAGQLGRLATR